MKRPIRLLLLGGNDRAKLFHRLNKNTKATLVSNWATKTGPEGDQLGNSRAPGSHLAGVEAELAIASADASGEPSPATRSRTASAGDEAGDLRGEVLPVDKLRFQVFLRDWVYDGRTLTELAKPGMWWGLGVMVVGLCFAWPQDRKAREILEHGRRVRGAEKVAAPSTVLKQNNRIIGQCALIVACNSTTWRLLSAVLTN